MRRSTFITYAKEQPVAHTHTHTHAHPRDSMSVLPVCVWKFSCMRLAAVGVLGVESCMPPIIYEFDYFKLRCLNSSQRTSSYSQHTHSPHPPHTLAQWLHTHSVYSRCSLACCARLLRVSSINHQAAASTLLAFYILKNRYICLNLFASARWSGKRKLVVVKAAVVKCLNETNNVNCLHFPISS